MMNARSIDRQPTKLWRLHQKRIMEPSGSSLVEEVTAVHSGPDVRMPPKDTQRPNLPIEWLLELWSEEHPDQDVPSNSALEVDAIEKCLFELGLSFLRAAEDNDIARVTQLLEYQFPVNFPHPRTLETALHIAAARSHRGVIRALIARDDCDVLAQDFVGRFPFNTAYFFGNDPAIERLLLTKARKRARADGLDLFRTQMQLLEKWAREDWYNARAEDASPPRAVYINTDDDNPQPPRPRLRT